MNRSKKEKIFKDYLTTIIVSIIVIFLFALCLELELLFRCENKVNFEELNVENLSKFATLEELEKRLLNEPDNYIVNIKLAQIYESLNQSDKAKDYYQNALKLSGRSNYSLYSYAMFCANENLFVIASTLAEELSGNNQKVNDYKARIYERIADNFDKTGNYKASVKSYQIVYKYAKNLSDKDFYDKIRDKYAREYIKLADYHIENDEVEEAIFDLKNSIKIKTTPLAQYKLGLIYINIDKRTAEKLINSAFYSSPFLVNPYIYNSILEKLMNEAKLEGNEGTLNHYSIRQKRFKNKLANVYLYKNNVIIENSVIFSKKRLFFNKQKYYLFFDLKNNTKQKLDNLTLKIELFVNNKRFEIEKKILTKTHPLDFYEELNGVKIDLPSEIEFSNLKENNDIIVKYYAKKINKAPWTLIKIELVNF